MRFSYNHILIPAVCVFFFVFTRKEESRRTYLDPLVQAPDFSYVQEEVLQARPKGKLLRKNIITYRSYGCFHYEFITIEIEDYVTEFRATVRKGGSKKATRVMLLAPSFAKALAVFNQAYEKRKLAGKRRMGGNYIGTVRKLEIFDGFRTVEFFVDNNVEVLGFFKLLNAIERHIQVAKKG